MEELSNARICDLREVAEHHYQKIDDALARGDEVAATSHERMANVIERMISKEEARLEREISEAPRRAAEARLAYHLENDTLDLY
mgnify:CR=1 FL=1